MTVIAYHRGIMAADSLLVSDDVNIVTSRKIERRDGYLVGMRGEACPSMAEAMDWLFTVEGKKKRKRHAHLKGYIEPFRFWDDRDREEAVYSFTLIMIAPDGAVFEVDQEGGLEPIPIGYHAIGSGSKYALAVMDHDPKADAIAAVRAGIKRSAFCRPPIYWYGLDGSEGEVKE